MHIWVAWMLVFGLSVWPADGHVAPGDPLIIVNKTTNRLAWIRGGKIRLEMPVATGKTNDLTPEGFLRSKSRRKILITGKRIFPAATRAIRSARAGSVLMRAARTAGFTACTAQTILLQSAGIFQTAASACRKRRSKSCTKKCRLEQKFTSPGQTGR